MVLKDCKFEEWFVHYIKPYVHYIPLKEDLYDIKEVMEWVLDHPNEVKKKILNRVSNSTWSICLMSQVIGRPG